MKKIKLLIDKILEIKISPVSWMLNFLGIIMARLFLDKFIAKTSSPLFDLIMDIHNIFFFLLSFLLVWLVLSLILRKKPFELAYLMLWTSLFIILPPIFDLIKTNGEVFWSFYLISSPFDLFRQWISFFGNLSSGVVYYGTKITFILAIFSLMSLVFAKTKSIFKGILTGILVYTALFFMASFPSFLAYLGLYISRGRFLDIKPFEIIQWFSDNTIFGIEIRDITYSLAFNLNIVYFLLILAILFVFFYISKKKIFLAVLKNFRYPQVVYHSGLLFLGIFFGLFIYPENLKLGLFPVLGAFALLVSVWLSWKTSVITNDIHDLEIDRITNTHRPLPKGIISRESYKNLGIISFVLAILLGFSLHYKIGWMLVFYQVLAWFYSAPPFRLKRFTFLSTFLSSIASLIIFMVGFILISPQQDLVGFSWRIFFLLLITYTLCLPIKDLKDIKGDKRYGVKTIPVLLGEEKSRLFIGVSFFVSYVLSVFFLNEWNLFWWSLVFGSLAFWIINNKKIAPRRLIWWNLGIVFVYGLILIRIVFF